MGFQLVSSPGPGPLQLVHVDSSTAASSKSYVWKDGLPAEPPKPRAGRIDPNVWERHKQEICQLYILDDLPLDQVRQHMKHDFSASKHQWTTQLDKWGYIKKASHRRPRPDAAACTSSSLQPGRPLTSTPSSDSSLSRTPSEGPKSPETPPIIAQQLTSSYKTFNAASKNFGLKSGFIGHYTDYRSLSAVEQRFGQDSRSKGLVSGLEPNIVSSPPSSDRVGSSSPRPTSQSGQKMVSEARFDTLQATRSLPTPCQIPSFDTSAEIQMRSLSLGDEHDGTISRAQGPTQSAKILDSLLKDPAYTIELVTLSDSDVQELITASNFLFAAQSYQESFKICQALMLSIGQFSMDEHVAGAKNKHAVWLPVALQMAKSATTRDDYLAISRMIKSIPSPKGRPVHDKINTYCMLYAFVGNICLEVADYTQAEKACFKSWTHYQTLDEKQALVQYIISAVLSELQFGAMSRPSSQDSNSSILTRFKDRFTANAFLGLATKGFEVKQPIVSPMIDKHLQNVLAWCVEAMSQQEFFFMIANVDNAFWNKGVDDHDVLQFERRVIYCYLCDRLWHCERSEKKNLSNPRNQGEVLASFEEILKQSGLSGMDVLAIIAKLLSMQDNAPRRSRTRATLPERYLQLIEALRQDMIIQNAGYARLGGWLSSNNLLEYYEWPRKLDDRNRFHDSTYSECVKIFLRDFMSMSLELDLSKRLQQTAECFRKAQAAADTTLLPKSSRSSQISDDYKSFKATAKKISRDAAMSIDHRLELPSAGMEDLMSETSSTRSLFQYSLATGGSKRGDTSLKGSRRKLASHASARMSDRMSLSASSLTRSSIMELD
ncbi:hypothetical protein H2198_001986 [Neophaeococcomyces mojaviensis]|uniref:Uncharacterized protein n=1 Tax=Neophaeococcomyces mojaviensis TaxID=3383035 RepID=A0ACC3AFJ0_9EURO|nr:hypothetical protein H2198_001986 [Knufia sp. JES_112]